MDQSLGADDGVSSLIVDFSDDISEWPDSVVKIYASRLHIWSLLTLHENAAVHGLGKEVGVQKKVDIFYILHVFTVVLSFE